MIKPASIRSLLFVFIFLACAPGFKAHSADKSEMSFQNKEPVYNTFVGNGGNSGDIELDLTRSQIQKTAEAILEIDNSRREEFCTCPDAYEGMAICEPLKAMTSNELQYCRNNLEKNAKSLLDLLSEKNEITWEWSDAPLRVVENGKTRSAEAATNVEQKKITIVRGAFMKMRFTERVFLLTHELLHFTKHNGKYIEDSASIGPFTGVDGGRRYLNANGSALAMMGHNEDVYRSDFKIARRSQNHMRNWLAIGIGGKSSDEPSTFGLEKWGGGYLEYQRQFSSHWGAFARARSFSAQKDLFTSTHAEANETGYSLGFSGRFFPVEDPMTFWGQSFFQYGLGVEYMRGEYDLDDSSLVKYHDSTDSFSALIRLQYFIPIQYGLWLYTEVSGTHHNYKYNDFNVESKPIQGYFYLGAAYAY